MIVGIWNIKIASHKNFEFLLYKKKKEEKINEIFNV